MSIRSILPAISLLLGVCALLGAEDAVARRLTLQVDSVRAPAASVVGLRVVVDDASSAAAANLHVDARRIDIPTLHLRGGLSWTCALKPIVASARECTGPVTLATTSGVTPAMQLRVRVDATTIMLTASRDDHAVMLTLPIAGDTPSKFALTSVPATWLKPLLDQAWPKGRLDAGTFDISGDYASDGSADMDFSVRDGRFSSNDGSLSGSNLALSGHLDTTTHGAALSVAGQMQISAGHFALGDFIAAPVSDTNDDAPVELKFSATGDAGVWNVAEFSWRDPSALSFAATGVFDTNALAPLQSLDLHLERASFPQATDRYGAAVWAKQGLAGVALSGDVAGDVSIDAHGVRRIALATEKFDVSDPARRIHAEGLHGGIDWTPQGVRPPVNLGWRKLDVAGVAVPAASARWQSRAGRMHLRDAFKLKLFGGGLKLTKTVFDPLDLAAGASADFEVDKIDYDAPDGAFALSHFGARGKMRLSLAGEIPRVQLDAALTGGEALAGAMYVKLPANPVILALDATGSGSQWQVANFAWHDQDVLDVAAKATLALDAVKPVQALDVDLREVKLQPFLDRYARSWAASKHYADLSASGSVSGSLRLDGGGLRALQVNAKGAGIRDGGGRFSVDGLTGNFVWSAGEDAEPAQVSWTSIDILRLPLGAGKATLTTRDGVIGLDAPLSVDVLGGKIRLEKLRIEPRSPQGERYAASFAIVGLEMAQVSAALGWPRFPGNLSGGIPEIELFGDKLTLRGGLDLYVFDGHVGVSGLELQRPFGFSPTLAANMHFENLDLEQLTRAFSFGGISGRLDGSITELKLVDWSPVAFDAWLHSVGAGRMSYKAVADVTAIGGGGGLSTNMQTLALKIVNTFGYDRLGIRCKLADAVCAMAGIDPLPQPADADADAAAADASYTIVEGAGIPRISIVGHRRRVDWPTLVRRLVEATQGQGPVIN